MRSKSGALLIEALVAILVGAMMALSLTALLAQTLIVTSATTNQMAADQIGRSVIDTLRGLDYQTIDAWSNQSFPLEINRASGDTTLGPLPHQLPLGLDSNSFQWTPLSVSNSFKGAASIQIDQGPLPNALLATVTVTWTDSQKITPHSSIYSTLITNGGENYWQ